jgi:lipopolysaccharide/colanic/teichoic acid biosynthesis glycosyltransferase
MFTRTSGGAIQDSRLRLPIDVTLALMGTVLLLPLLLIVALLVRIDSPGPALFSHTRIGRHGRPFKVFKFRTMVVNSEHMSRETLGTDDPRITRLGAHLRRWKIDELPQLVNVIRGDMSLVGPRPEIPYYVERYSEEQRVVLAVRPGITDPSSIALINLDEVMASRGDEPAPAFYARVILPKKIELQKSYLANRSILSDLVLITKTVIRLFRGRP